MESRKDGFSDGFQPGISRKKAVECHVLRFGLALEVVSDERPTIGLAGIFGTICRVFPATSGVCVG